jgi:RNA ligase (TIGR02306 family)
MANTERKLVSLKKIEEIQPIENADRIEKARIGGWWVVIQKGKFNVGDLVAYYEIDSFLPLEPKYDFLLSGTKPKKLPYEGKIIEGIRLKTKKLKGCISQGLILPLDELVDKLATNEGKLEEGTDITDELGVIKYEKPWPAELAGIVKGSFPGFLPKTDEPRLQNCGHVLTEKDTMYVTEKLDGCSATFYKRNGEFGVCSRNLELQRVEFNIFWKVAKEYDLENKIDDNYCVQGEIIGVGIQGNPYRQSGHKFYAYNVLDIKEQRYLDYYEMRDWLILRDIDVVPLTYIGPMPEGETIENLIEEADGKSMIAEEVNREGLVWRPVRERRVEIQGSMRRFSFKTISNKYLLENEQ